MTNRSDEELMASAGRGDREAFGLLAERHQRTLIHFITRFLGLADPTAAEDLSQDALLAAWRAAPAFQPRSGVQVLSWLLRITTNICLNHRRGARLRVTLPLGEAPADPALDGAERLASSERVGQVRAAIAALPPAQRAALLLREFHGLSYAEIAVVIETSVSAVESLLVRARRGVALALTSQETEAPPQVSLAPGADPG